MTLRWLATATRRRLALAVALVLVLGVAAAAFVEVREQRAAAAAAAAADTARALARADRADDAARAVAAAESATLAAERSAHARAVEVAARAAADADLTARIAAAEPVLAASADQVADDAVRQALAAALDGARAALAARVTLPALASAGASVDGARTTVEQAHAAWRTETDAAASAAEDAAAGDQAAAPGPAAPAAPGGAPVFVTSVPTADGDGSNGHMPASAMCLIPWGTDQIGSPQYLRCDAAAALTRLNDAFRAQFGEPIAMDLTYRSYADQVAIRAYYGALAARPGTSNHGLGLALDLQEWPGVYGFGTPRYVWLVANGPAFGWSAPASVREGAAYPEYWHFEFSP
ncbi:M15 family metallopeptidase [Pengzhenrongella sicca]|uniref:M15 family metallopeptidase n=1 Tax=Pengzhenrongella sicca TaxID=2819238 RepID=A0A8A4ZFZ7_9MICO|nr:M15 family metallopeptidase [Pengzhenrongella sicca]QTE30205.1 M15 family metallopeptidase [Pengzhenrongella sicca]